MSCNVTFAVSAFDTCYFTYIYVISFLFLISKYLIKKLHRPPPRKQDTCLRGTTNQQSQLLNGHLTQRSKLIFSIVIKSEINPGAHFG